jgi:hypothetical protein
MLTKTLLTIALLSLGFLWSGEVQATVIFQDDFESDSSDWICTDGELSKWTSGWGDCYSTSGFGAEWRMGSGRTGGNAVYSYKKSGVSNGWRTLSRKYVEPLNIKEAYMRWYMKVPPANEYNKAIESGFKLNQIFVTGGGGALYHNVKGNTFAGGQNGMWLNNVWDWYEFTDVSNFNDGQWHCHEIRVKMNDESASNGILQYWLDGELTASYENIVVNPSSPYFQFVTVGVANVSDSDWYQTEWSAIGFDDFVLSAEYVGPDDASDTTPPSRSNGSPSGELPAGNTQAAMTLTTNENATCKFATNSGTAYSSMTDTFSTTGGTNHSTAVTGLQNGQNYTRYIKCIDSSGNANTDDFTISWSVAEQSSNPQPGNLLFSESFENSNFSSRNWYDGNSTAIEPNCYSGNCLKWAWSAGQSRPANTTTMRRLFTAKDELFIRYRIKLGSEWRGHQESFGGPHLVHVLSDSDGVYGGLSWTNLSFYSELFSSVGSPYTTYPRVMIQDGARINTSQGSLPNNLINTTETRAVAGCNGNLGDAGNLTSCYQSGGYWFNGRFWDTNKSIQKDQWALVEIYLKMNSISNNKGVADGVLKYWLNGEEVQNSSAVVYRTGDQPNKKWNQFVLAPFMGSSPINQAMYIDELEVYDGLVDSQPSIPGDINGDGVVNIFDYNIFLQHFGVVEDCQNSADLNGDCAVNIFDYNVLLQNFGRTQ